ncbi:MAG: tripartite tricarboxylate transporter TctB family protein [Pseudorhodoplanes sp.]
MKPSGKMTADRIGGLIWIALGAAIVYGSWAMDRLTSLQIHPATAPGLVPGLLGAGIAILGAILLFRRERSSTGDFGAASDAQKSELSTEPEEGAEESVAWKRMGLSWLLCITYGAVLLGHGLPYWILTAAFLLLHIVLIDDTDDVPAKFDVRRAVTAAIVAIFFSTAVALVFEKIFLVRLP